MSPVLLIALAAILTSFAQVVTKYFTHRHPVPNTIAWLDWKIWFSKLITLPHPWVIILMLFVASIAWFAILKRINFSIAYSCTISLTLFLNFIASFVLFDENFNIGKLFACFLLIIGIFLLAR